jgi:cytosine/adenosine deaminase-related metal-dependent hydrolase
LGNDGFSNNMFTEMHATCLLHKHATGDPRAMSAAQVLHMAFTHNAHIAAHAGLPIDLGTLKVGAPADVIVINYRPTTPLTEDNMPWHILFGIDGTDVETTIVGGNVLMKGGQLFTLDEAEIARRSRQAARQVWERLGQGG